MDTPGPAQGALQENQGPSALLRCLSQLDEGAWAQVLLPKLIAQGSAQAVAATCSQLRDLCFGAVVSLNLSSLQDSSDTSNLEAWVQPIPSHFKHVTIVKLLFREALSYYTAAYLLPALQELPKLESVTLTVAGDPHPLMCPVLCTSTMLYTLRAQLKGRLRSLHLNLQLSLIGADAAWQELGRCTTLTLLKLECDKEVDQPLDQQDLLPLANLHSLERLEVSSGSDFVFEGFSDPLLSAQLAGGLTALTCLDMWCRASGLRHVGSCKALRVLKMRCPLAFGVYECLGDHEWAAVGQLKRLSQLVLASTELLTATEECRAAVSKLTRLEAWGVGLWSTDMLPVLAACTQLTWLGGGWQQGSSSSTQGIVLPGVLELADTFFDPPFAALPGLTMLEQLNYISTDAFSAMCKHCTRLLQLKAVAEPKEVRTLLSYDPALETARGRTAAVKGLSALTRLTYLELMVDTSIEVIALADAVQALLPCGFGSMAVYVMDAYVRPCTLMHLARLQGLPDLLLQLNPESAALIVQDAAGFLSALSGIQRVTLMGLKSEHVVAFEAAQAVVEEAGLPCPSLKVQE